jgi:AcrR family transcriptional regulator
MPARPSSSTAVRQRRARGSISPKEVVTGAIELCRTETVDGLSMPRLAQHLDVGVTSIYWYFKSKEDLLDALSDEAFTRFYAQMPPLAGRQWDEVLREYFTNFRTILRADPVLCDLVIMRGGRYRDDTLGRTWERIEGILEVLVAAGFTADEATTAYFTLSVYTRGCLFIERNMRTIEDTEGGGHPKAHLAESMPVLSSVIGRYGSNMIGDDDFAAGVENNLRGLRTLLASRKPQRRR